MFKKALKKTLSLVLAAILVFSTGSIAFAGGTETDTADLPIITVFGFTGRVSGNDGQAFNLYEAFGSLFEGENLDTLLNTLKTGYLTGDWAPFTDAVCEPLKKSFENGICDENGNPIGESGAPLDSWNNDVSPDFVNINSKQSDYRYGEYPFYIDWRIDPMASAELLNQYIEAVCAATGKEQVYILGRCLGASVIVSYISKYGSSRIADMGFYIPAVEGIDLFGALFAGKIDFTDADAIDRFADYFIKNGDLIADSDTRELVTNLVSVVNKIKVLGLAAHIVQGAFEKMREELIPRVIMDTIGTYPAFWSMVGLEYFDEAVNLIFGEEGSENRIKYAGIYENVTAYNDSIKKNVRPILESFRAEGKRVFVIAKYNTPLYPIYEGCEKAGDGVCALEDISFGAAGGAYGQALSAGYLENKNAEYISPDKMIDASAGMFPDTTWFIKNCEHGDYPTNINPFLNYIFSDTDIKATDNNAQWPQWLDYEKETRTIVPLDTESEDLHNTWNNNAIRVFIDFIKNMFKLFVKLIKGEISFNKA